MTLHDFNREEASKELSIRELPVNQLSVEQYFQWIQQQPEAERDRFELVEGKVHSLPSSTEQMRMLRLLQWQLQHFLKPDSAGSLETATDEKSHFEVHVRPSVQLGEFSHLKPAILVRKGSVKDLETEDLLDPNTVWITDIAADSADQTCIQLYAQAGISDYWSLKHNIAELNLYQQPNASGYQSHRVLQVGDRASPNSVPITVRLQEPVPLHFMTRTLRGQQTYASRALPLSFSRSYSLSSTRIRTESP